MKEELHSFLFISTLEIITLTTVDIILEFGRQERSVAVSSSGFLHALSLTAYSEWREAGGGAIKNKRLNSVEFGLLFFPRAVEVRLYQNSPFFGYLSPLIKSHH